MDKMDWHLIRDLYETKSMAKAGERLFLSQPAVSYRMLRMEKEFGKTLFTRSNRGVDLTSAGMRLFSYANLMLQYEDFIYEQIHSDSETISGQIEFGATSNFVVKFLMEQMKEFRELYPNLTYKIVIDSTPNLIKRMNNKEILLSIIRGKSEWPGPSIELFSEPLVVIAPCEITDEYLRTNPRILNDYKSAVAEPIEMWINEYFGDMPPQISSVQFNGNSSVLKAGVKAGFGWAVISQTRFGNEEGLYSMPICHKDGTPCLYQTNLVYFKECEELDSYRLYLAHLKEYFRGREIS